MELHHSEPEPRVNVVVYPKLNKASSTFMATQADDRGLN